MATSSLLTPKATWVRTMSASSASSASGVPIGKRPQAVVGPRARTAPGRPAHRLMVASARNAAAASGSTQSIWPGPSRPRRTLPCPAIGTAPTSDAQTTNPSSQTWKRSGRSPLRSRAAPTRRPSVKIEPGRAVPRLGQAGVVAEEVADLGRAGPGCPPRPRGRAWPRRGGCRGRRARAARPRCRACRSRSPRGRAAGEKSSSGPRPAVLGAEPAPGGHAVLVAPQRVDLAVVAQVPERLGPLPGRRGVGREAGVEHRQRRVEVGGGQVGVEARQAVAHDQRLVDDGGERPAGEVVPDAGLPAGGLGPAPGPEAAPFGVGRAVERSGAASGGRARIAWAKCGALRRAAAPSRRVVGRDGSPAEEHEPFGGAGVGHGLLGDPAGVVVGRSRKAVTTPSGRVAAGRRSPASRATRAKNGCGMGSRIPAPSPEMPSAATADRWRTQASPTRAESSRARLARPSTSATRPMPQASRSKPGGRSEAAHATSWSRQVGPRARKERRPWTSGGWDDAAVVHPIIPDAGSGASRRAGRRTTPPGTP